MIQVDGIFVQGGGGPVFPEFTYTGDYHIVNEGTPDWKIYFTSSGTFTPVSNIAVQAQLIGGGSGGNSGNSIISPRKGGGGGNAVINEFILEAGKNYQLIIGSGGKGANAGGPSGSAGGNTSGFGITANGGSPATPVNVFEFGDTLGVRQSGTGGDGGAGAGGSDGQNAGDIDPNIGGGKGGVKGSPGGNGNFGSVGGNNFMGGSGGGGGGGGYGGGGGGGGLYSGGGASGGAGAPGVIIMRNTRLSA